MTKPTFMQTLLGRPSQSYSFPKEKDYYSSRQHMLRAASEAVSEDEHAPIPPLNGYRHFTPSAMIMSAGDREDVGEKGDKSVMMMGKDSDSAQTQPELGIQPPPARVQRNPSSSTLSEDESVDVFYTPNPSPRVSVASTTTLGSDSPSHSLPPSPLSERLRDSQNISKKRSKSDMNDSTIATRTPLPARSVSSLSTSSVASNSLDGHSLFSADSSPNTESTKLTSPPPSDYGPAQTDKYRSSSGKPKKAAKGSGGVNVATNSRVGTYAGDDWAKDVRWLVPLPSNSSSNAQQGPFLPSSKSTSTTKKKPTRSASYGSPSSSSSSTVTETLYTNSPTHLRGPTRTSSAPAIPQPSAPGPRKNIAKSLSKTNPSIMMNMTALLEEDEDAVHYSIPKSSVLLNAPLVSSPLRETPRTGPPPSSRQSNTTPSSSGSTLVPQSSASSSSSTSTTSTSRRRHHGIMARPNLSRRKSRSLEDLSKLYEEDELDGFNLPSSASSSSYTSPSLPSYGTPGYTSLTLPRAPQPVFNNTANKRMSNLFAGLDVVGSGDGKVDLTRSGVAQTTMATVEVTKGIGRGGGGIPDGNTKSGLLGSFLGRSKTKKMVSVPATSRSSKGKGKSESPLSFTSYRKPPSNVPEGSVLVQVWAVGVDGVDAKLCGVVPTSASGPKSVRGSDDSAEARPGQQRSMSETGLGRPGGGLMRSMSMASRRKGKGGSQEDGSGGRIPASPTSNSGRIPAPEVGFIPGRSFVGRVLECGFEVTEDVVRKGEWVVGLLDVKKCGALQEFIVVDRHRIVRIPHPALPTSALTDPVSRDDDEATRNSNRDTSDTSSSILKSSSHPHSSRYPVYVPSTPSTLNSLSRSTSVSSRIPSSRSKESQMTLEELALLPLCGVQAYRAVRTFAFSFLDRYPERKRRALILRGHDGVGAIATQMLAKKGWKVTVHASVPDDFQSEEEEKAIMIAIEDRIRGWGGDEVIFDDAGAGESGVDDEGRGAVVRVIEQLVGDGDVFDAVLDTVGGKEIWEASERLLRNIGNSPKPTRSRSDSSSSSSVGTVGGGLKRGFGSLRRKPTSGSSASTQANRGVGQFTTLFGDSPGRVIPTASDHFKAGLRSMKNNHNHKDGDAAGSGNGNGNGNGNGTGGNAVSNGKVGYAWISIAQDVDWEGHDVRDSMSAVVKSALEDGIRPWVGDMDKRTATFERTPDLFTNNGPLGDGGTAVVKVVA